MLVGLTEKWLVSARRAAWLAAIVTVIFFAGGCGAGLATSPSSAAAPSQYNTYAGTQIWWGALADDIWTYGGGVWSMTIDDATQYFTHENVSNPLRAYAPSSVFPGKGVATFTSSKGFRKLKLYGNLYGKEWTLSGYFVEVPGRAAMLVPEGIPGYPVVAVSSGSCAKLTENTTFQFITLGGRGGKAAYGSVKVKTDGPDFTFSDMKMSLWDGAALSTKTPPRGSCEGTREGYVTSVLPSPETYDLPLTVAIGPSGYFVMDQGQGDSKNKRNGPEVGSTGPFGLVGVAQPSSPVDTNAVISGKYAGFEYTLTNAGTFPVVFGNVAGYGTVMNGGDFPGRDVTKDPLDNISLDLGPQDSQNNGLFPSVTVTVPDTYGGCVFQPYGGKDAKGNPTCILRGVAVVGNPDGKYVVFVTVRDRSLEQPGSGAVGPAREFFLYPQ